MLNTIFGSLSEGVAPSTTSYESIATVTVGAGGSANVEFTSIPSTYSHLQIRCIYQSETAGDNLGMTVNTSTNISKSHSLYGAGSTANAIDYSVNILTIQVGTSATTFYGAVFDILDYKDTNKYKTVRVLGGGDFNGSGVVFLSSGLLQTTSAITSVKLQNYGGNDIAQYSQFALYGIKGS